MQLFVSLSGLVLGSFFYGYWVLQIPGAWLAMRIGGTRVFGYGVLLTSFLSLLTPVATRYSVWGLVGVRIFQGLFLVRNDNCYYQKYIPILLLLYRKLFQKRLSNKWRIANVECRRMEIAQKDRKEHGFH